MILLALLLLIAAFALFGVASDRHHPRLFRQRPAPAQLRRMRLCGWIGLAAAAVPALAARGWIFGPVLWAGLVMLAAGIVFLALNLRQADRR